jgi:hypothetical protein
MPHTKDNCPACSRIEPDPVHHPNFPAWLDAVRQLLAQGVSDDRIVTFNGSATPQVKE